MADGTGRYVGTARADAAPPYTPSPAALAAARKLANEDPRRTYMLPELHGALPVMKSGKHAGAYWNEVLARDPAYARWVAENGYYPDFAAWVKRQAL